MKLLLRREVLNVLNQVSPYLLPQESLINQLNAALGAAITEAELDEALQWLHEKGFIDYTLDQMTEVVRWKITPAGLAKFPK